MGFKESPLWIWWKEYGKHIEALFIILLLSAVWFAYSENNKLSVDIKNNCGWGEEDYYCYCERSKAMEIKNIIESGVNNNLKLKVNYSEVINNGLD